MPSRSPTLYEMVGWTSLYMRGQLHFYVFIYKMFPGKLPLYIGTLLSYQMLSARWLILKVPRAVTELGDSAFSYCAREEWNSLQSTLHLYVLVPLSEFKTLCKCFL